MAFDKKKAAPAENGSTGGKAEQRYIITDSATSVNETGRKVKGGFDYVQARRLADMLTDLQWKNILLLALAIRETERGRKEAV